MEFLFQGKVRTCPELLRAVIPQGALCPLGHPQLMPGLLELELLYKSEGTLTWKGAEIRFLSVRGKCAEN